MNPSMLFAFCHSYLNVICGVVWTRVIFYDGKWFIYYRIHMSLYLFISHTIYRRVFSKRTNRNTRDEWESIFILHYSLSTLCLFIPIFIAISQTPVWSVRHAAKLAWTLWLLWTLHININHIMSNLAAMSII